MATEDIWNKESPLIALVSWPANAYLRPLIQQNATDGQTYTEQIPSTARQASCQLSLEVMIRHPL
jgi:hypothetical protein